MEKIVTLAGRMPLACCLVAFAADMFGQPVPAGCDPSVMSAAYWLIWNDAEQAKIDADIEANPKPAYRALDGLINRQWRTNLSLAAGGGKVAFRGFRGRYRLSWTGADGKLMSEIVEVR